MIHAKQTLCEYCTTVQPLIANTSSDFAELPKASAEPSHQKIEDLTQELVDLLGTALADFKFGGGGQEAYVAGILVLRCALVAAMFTEEYLDAVRSGTMPEKEGQNIRRSKFYGLKTPDALKILYGLGQYILSDQAEIEQVKCWPRIIMPLSESEKADQQTTNATSKRGRRFFPFRYLLIWVALVCRV